MTRGWFARCLVAAPLVLASAVGCQWLVGINDIEQSSPDASSDASSEQTIVCDANVCSGVCVELASDGKNCGTCGHDCLGGVCDAGVCQPVILASGQTAPIQIAVNSTEVFWVDWATTGAVMRCEKAGCAKTPTQLYSATNPHAVAADENNVYWTSDDGTVAQCPVSGCNPAPIALATNQPSPLVGLAIDATNVYWTRFIPGTNGGHFGIFKCTIGGCSAPSAVVDAFLWPVSVPLYLAVDATNAYCTTDIGQIAACALDGGSGAPTFITSGMPKPMTITVDSARLFWTDYVDGGGVMVRNKSANNTTQLVAADRPLGLAVDNTDAYFTTPFGGSVLKCALNGCSNTPKLVAGGQAGPSAVAVDSTAVYWTNMGDGTIMKLAK